MIGILIKIGVQHQPLTSIPLPWHPALTTTCYRSPVTDYLHDDDDHDDDDDDDGDDGDGDDDYYGIRHWSKIWFVR